MEERRGPLIPSNIRYSENLMDPNYTPKPSTTIIVPQEIASQILQQEYEQRQEEARNQSELEMGSMLFRYLTITE